MKISFKKIISIAKRKNSVFWIVLLVTALVVAAFLLYTNLGVIKVWSFFERIDPYKNSLVLFSGDGCSQCTKVDTFIAANDVATKIQFVELEVFNNSFNKRVLIDKATVCGMDVQEIGVPFLWDGQGKRCVIGYLDVIDFFKTKLAQIKKSSAKPM